MSGPAFSEELRECWREPALERVEMFQARHPVPGDLALRARYETLVDLGASGVPTAGLAVDRQLWSAQIHLSRQGDAALQRNDTKSADSAFKALADTHVKGQHPLPLIEAETGLGDSARQQGDIRRAASHYRRALGKARRAHARFAEIRAGLALGYIQLEAISVRSAQESFQRAASVSEAGDWRLERGNALIALGECDTRLRRPLSAHRHLLDALSTFETLNSRQGVANATYQLGDACRRARWLDDADGWYRQSLIASASLANSIVRVNALDGLAEVEVKSQRWVDARRHLGEASRLSLAIGYRRGFAHAIQGLAGEAVARGETRLALTRYRLAAELYEHLSLPTSTADAIAGIARCADRLGERELEVVARLDALRCIENSRSAQVTDADQDEYLERFGHHYLLCLIASIRRGRIDAFVAAFEALAGRRLAGLVASDTDPEAARRAQLVAQLVRLNDASVRMPKDETTDPNPDRAFRRRLGKIALRMSLPSLAGEAFSDAAAAAYLAFDPAEAMPLWDTITKRHRNVVLLADSPDGSQLVWLARVGANATPHAGIIDLPVIARSMVEHLHRTGLPANITLEGLAPLGALLPKDLVTLLPATGDLTLVTAGRLWAVPWCALIPEGEEASQVLGERFAITRSPTLALLAAPCTAPEGEQVAWWCSSDVKHHRVEAFLEPASGQSVVHLDSGAEARLAVLTGAPNLVVLVTHGRPIPGMVHYLDLDDGIALTPADMLQSRPPPRLALIACWGAGSPGQGRSDPMSIAAMARIRGTAEVLATTSELLDDPPSSRFMNSVLHAARSTDFPRALQIGTIRFLARPEYRDGPVARWAPLMCLGG